MAAEVRSVAVLGTGIMGAPIARNLARARLAVSTWNRTREKAEALHGDGIEVAASPSQAATGADAVLTMLADADAVRGVMTGEGGALAAMEDGAVWIQASTIGIEGTDEMAGLAARRNVPFIDAPVLGTRQPAEQGRLVVLASGDPDAAARCRPVFAAIGDRTVELGEAGAGTRMKLVVNDWVLTLTAGLAETMALAEALGAEPAKFLEIIDGNPAGSPYAQLKGRLILDREFEPAFPLRLAAKDARLVLEAGAAAGLELPLAHEVERRFAEAERLGHGDEDMAAVYRATGARVAGRDDRRGAP